jgi:hypothetical protein
MLRVGEFKSLQDLVFIRNYIQTDITVLPENDAKYVTSGATCWLYETGNNSANQQCRGRRNRPEDQASGERSESGYKVSFLFEILVEKGSSK